MIKHQEGMATAREVHKGNKIASTMSGGYWAVEEKTASGELELVGSWLGKEEARKLLNA